MTDLPRHEPVITPTELDARPVLPCPDDAPVCGVNYDIVLLEEGRPLSRCAPALAEDILRAGSRSRRLSSILWAAPLTLCDRAALFLSLPQDGAPSPLPPSELVLLPSLPAHTALGALWQLMSEPDAAGTLPAVLHRSGDARYVPFLRTLLCTARSALLVPPRSQSISQASQLSQPFKAALRGLSSLLGQELPGAYVRELPLFFPFTGTLYPVLLRRMLLLLSVGLLRGFSPQVVHATTTMPDPELLLPQWVIPAGNKTPLPPEWLACQRIARHQDCLFDLRRHRDAVHVRFCPLVPQIPAKEFYHLQAKYARFFFFREASRGCCICNIP